MNDPIEQEPPTPDPYEVARERRKFWFWSVVMFAIVPFGLTFLDGWERMSGGTFGRLLFLAFIGFMVWAVWGSTLGFYLTRRAFPEMRGHDGFTIVVVTAARAIARMYRRMFRR